LAGIQTDLLLAAKRSAYFIVDISRVFIGKNSAK
jgi:hypothetical protein